MPGVVAYVPDLMDRSRLSGAVPEVRFVGAAAIAGAAVDADVVVVDLAARGGVDAARTARTAGARTIGFGPHVDDELLTEAAAAGIETMARSRFFRDPAAALARRVEGRPDARAAGRGRRRRRRHGGGV